MVECSSGYLGRIVIPLFLRELAANGVCVALAAISGIPRGKTIGFSKAASMIAQCGDDLCRDTGLAWFLLEALNESKTTPKN